MSPLVAEVYGPDEAGRQQVASSLAQGLCETPDIVGVDTSLQAKMPPAPFCACAASAPSRWAFRWRWWPKRAAMALSGVDAAYLHDGQQIPGARAPAIAAGEAKWAWTPCWPCPCVRPMGRWCPCPNWCKCDTASSTNPVHQRLAGRELCVWRHGGQAGLARCTACLPFADTLAKRCTCPARGRLGEYWIVSPWTPTASYAIKWDGEWQITYETFRDMGAAYGVGLILIYLLVVAQFRSYLTPLVIMAPIPLTIIGVMPGHAILGAQFTATSMIGMIALAGIIVRNSILLVDFIELQVAKAWRSNTRCCSRPWCARSPLC
jgi:hypothetical protein